MEEGFPSLVVDGSLRSVETLEVVLLRAIAGTLMWLDKARIAEEEQRLEEAWAIIAVLVFAAFST
jgi:hypothetical protein